MKLLWHEDVMKLLRKAKKKRVSALLDSLRKSSNSNYQAVVKGKRPSRADKKDQEVASKLSRENSRLYWQARLDGDL